MVLKSEIAQYDTLTYIGESFYQSRTAVQPSATYTCQVTIPGHQSVVCSNTIPEAPEIVGIQHINQAGRDEEGNTYPAVTITFKNNPDTIQYFHIVIKLMKYDSEGFAQIINITDPVLLNEGLPLTLFSNKLIVSDTYSMTINYSSGSVGSSGNGFMTVLFPFVVELRSISYDYYMHLK